MKILAAAAFVAAITVGTGASALTADYTTGDSAFIAKLGANGDKAVGELRWGNNSATGGDWEVAVGFPTSTGNQAQANYAWDGAKDFVLSYDGAGGVSLALDGVDPFLTYPGLTGKPAIDPTGFNALAIRADGRFGDTTLTNLKFSGMAFGSLTADDVVEYVSLSGVDLMSAWTLSGTVLFENTPDNRGSRPSFQIKLADLPSEVPLPAAAWMLLAALGGLAGMGARRKAA